ncbi:hypothetical protein DSL72_003983 [Monilinia vaccinii-corymbosi]|uniref:Uncharacterized protein n=1 Tax=Monilinia vaccinii-corymbosi TaxID=61207 RepID=A0A8A3P8E7_9HELO|nr:hypothetical protein DSL72_003983 [Monilinia vaccinii-corymbosi]
MAIGRSASLASNNFVLSRASISLNYEGLIMKSNALCDPGFLKYNYTLNVPAFINVYASTELDTVASPVLAGNIVN